MEIACAIILVLFFLAVIAKIIEKYRQKVRDKVAHEVIDKAFNYASEKAEVLSINRELDFVVNESIICPHCLGVLVERHGVHGAFMGCSNYPRCRFTKRID